MSLYTVVSRGVTGRLAQRRSVTTIDRDQTAPESADGLAAVRLPGASMRVLEASLALTAIATAILIGFGR